MPEKALQRKSSRKALIVTIVIVAIILLLLFWKKAPRPVKAIQDAVQSAGELFSLPDIVPHDLINPEGDIFNIMGGAYTGGNMSVPPLVFDDGKDKCSCESACSFCAEPPIKGNGIKPQIPYTMVAEATLSNVASNTPAFGGAASYPIFPMVEYSSSGFSSSTGRSVVYPFG